MPNIEQIEEKKPLTSSLDFLDPTVNELIDKPENIGFKRLIVSYIVKFKERNFLPIKSVEEELKSMDFDISVELENDDDIDRYRYVINYLQSYKDRLTHLVSHAQADYNFVCHSYNHLFKIWMSKYSIQGTDKKREGEAEMILHFMFYEMEERESLFNYVKNVLLNMNSKMEAVSRKITIVQTTHKIMGLNNIDPETKKEYKANVKAHSQKMREFGEELDKKISKKIVNKTEKKPEKQDDDFLALIADNEEVECDGGWDVIEEKKYR